MREVAEQVARDNAVRTEENWLVIQNVETSEYSAVIKCGNRPNFMHRIVNEFNWLCKTPESFEPSLEEAAST